MKQIKWATIAKKYPNRIVPYYQIGILFPNGKKIVKQKCTLEELFNTYFIGLDKYLNMDFVEEELLEKYQQTFENKGIKIVIRYVSSWGHTFKGKIAWPKEEWFLEYLNKRLYND